MKLIENGSVEPFWYRNYAHTQVVTQAFFSAMQERFPNKFEELMALVEEGNGKIFKDDGSRRYFIGIKDPEVAQEFSTLFKQLVDRYGTESMYTNIKKSGLPFLEGFELAPLPDGATKIDLDKEESFYFLRKHFAINNDKEEYKVSLEDVYAGVVGEDKPPEEVAKGEDAPPQSQGSEDTQALEEKIREIIAKYQLPVDKIVEEIIDVLT